MEGGEGGREDEVGIMGQVEDGETIVKEKGGEISQKIVREVELMKKGESRQPIKGSQAAAGQV